MLRSEPPHSKDKVIIRFAATGVRTDTIGPGMVHGAEKRMITGADNMDTLDNNISNNIDVLETIAWPALQ